MLALSSKDIASFNEAVLELHSTETAQEFPSKIHRAVRRLIDGDVVVVDWVNPRTSLSLGCYYDRSDLITAELNAFIHTILPTQAPMWLQCVDAPHACSDYMSRRNWARREICMAFREIALEEFIGFEARFSPSLTMMVADLRGSFGSYTDTERMKLQLLGPHLHQIHRRLAIRGNVIADSLRTLHQTEVRVTLDGRVSDWPLEARR
ncbi:MAG TPA: hypothetical protein VNB29_02360, partial [Chthoniobacterales bacterium]|nr:hypothetical protein [Chthoniobacterales bacterium]